MDVIVACLTIELYSYSLAGRLDVMFWILVVLILHWILFSSQYVYAKTYAYHITVVHPRQTQ
jgi:hypothetical protein